MVVFAIFLLCAFPCGRYRNAGGATDSTSGRTLKREPLRQALWEWINIWDLILEIGYALRILSVQIGSSYAIPSVLHVLCNTLVGAYVSL